MQKYDFDKPVNRFGTNCVKHDEMPDTDTIALWVADMDFETAPVVRQALLERMNHGCFGYTFVPDSYYEASINWFARRHNWLTERSWYIYTSGVVPAISAIIKGVKDFQIGSSEVSLDAPGSVSRPKVLVQTPVYNCFFSSIRNNGCLLEENRLVYNDGRYTIDWDDFESKCVDKDVKIFLLCNPHNPAGRVWTADELRRMGDICKRHDVFVIADEIHCEFVNPHPAGGTTLRYTPFASVSDAECAVCISPTKAFNIAGLQIANIVVANPVVRQRVDKAININEVCDVNPFGVIALQTAYSAEGEEWLAQLNEYIYSNYEFARDWLKESLPRLGVTVLEGTYLMWVDVTSYGMDSNALADYLLESANVYVNAGMMYGDQAGKNFIRINLATQRARLAEGLKRMKSALDALEG